MSANNLFQPSRIDTLQVPTVLAAQSNFLVSGGISTIYLEPTYKAGEDTLTVTIPGLDPIVIPVTVHAAAARKVIIDDIPSFAEPHVSIQTKLSLYDARDNPVTIPTPVEI